MDLENLLLHGTNLAAKYQQKYFVPLLILLVYLFLRNRESSDQRLWNLCPLQTAQGALCLSRDHGGVQSQPRCQRPQRSWSYGCLLRGGPRALQESAL